MRKWPEFITLTTQATEIRQAAIRLGKNGGRAAPKDRLVSAHMYGVEIVQHWELMYKRKVYQTEHGVNISGNVTIGKAAEIGTKSCFMQQVTVGCNVILGAGSTVISDIPDNCTAVGSPAKPIKFTNKDCFIPQ
ncbi:MAG: hypothetical protein WC231_00055 [Dehalococcoidales bacterium]